MKEIKVPSILEYNSPNKKAIIATSKGTLDRQVESNPPSSLIHKENPWGKSQAEKIT